MLSLISPVTPGVASTSPALVSCVDLQTKVERISKTGECRERKEAKKIWHQNLSDTPISTAESVKEINICSNRAKAKFSYQVIRSKCAPFQVSTIYARISALPAQPLLADAVSTAHDSVKLTLVSNPSSNPDAPVAFYTVTSNRGDVRRIFSLKNLSLFISGLLPESTYTFSVTATSADGTSKISTLSKSVTTPIYVPPTPAPTSSSTPVSPPSFTVTVSAETKTVNTSLTGYAISSTGGSVSSYAISPSAPAGTVFNSATGLLTGTPTNTQSTTTYTITASNASGSATQNFSLTVVAADSVISVAAIGGVTTPVTGATPVTSVTAANGYTGTVSWSGSPASFVALTTYTATITLTANSGYSLTGVSANFFTVASASSVTHSANSGVITAVFPATTVGAANKAMIQTQPSGAVNDVAFTTQPVVRVTDSAGNTVTSFTGNVVASKFSGSGTLGGTLTVAAVGGVATFTNLKLTGATGNHFLRFTPASLTFATSDTVTVTVGAPTKVAITRQSPTISASGSAFTTQPTIAIQDVSGITVTSATSVVTATASAGGTIVGVETFTAVSGVANFTNLGLSGTEGSSYTITYTVAGLTTATSSAIYLPRFCDGTSYNCQIGDTGPGGGKIFYVLLGGFKCGPSRTATCKYLEAAPNGWNTGSDPLRTWAQSGYQTTTVSNATSPETATATAIGWGYWNTRAIVLQGNATPSTSAAALTDSYAPTYNSTLVDDWFLPSRDELAQLINSAQYLGMIRDTYLSSSELSANFSYNYAINSSYGRLDQNDEKSRPRYVRAIRSF